MGAAPVKARANTRVTILRGTSTDAFGDPVDTLTEVRTGVTASIMEQRKTVTNPVDGMPRQVRFTTGRLPAGTDLRNGDRIKDEKTGVIYMFDASSQVENAIRTNDLRIDLRRVT